MEKLHPFLKYGTYILGTAASAKLLAHFYKKYFVHRKKEICDVFFLNEKSGCCWTHKVECTNEYCMSRVIDRVEREINSAKSIICIAMYMFTNQRFCDAVINAKNRGVTVRIIMDYSQRGATGSKLKDFEKAGIAVRINIDDASLMHHKFCLIDVTTEKTESKDKHPSDGLLITGSLNWTNNGMNRNWENVTFQSGTAIKTQFMLEFDRLWTDLGNRQSYVPATRH